jgi:PAS domain S-box-containing protein
MPSDSSKSHLLEGLIGNADLLLSVFASIQDGISILDNQLNIIAVNPAMEKWYAHAMPLVKKKCYAAYYGRNNACDVCPSRQTLQTGKTSREVVPMIGPEKQIVGWIDLHTFPLVDLNTGRLKGVIEYVRDISDQKKAEDTLRESEERYRKVVEQSWQGTLIAQGSPFRFVFANSRAAEILGYSAEQLITLTSEAILTLIHPDDLPAALKRFDDILNKGLSPPPREFCFIRKDGSPCWVEVFGRAVQVQGEPALQIAMLDVTERWRAEDALKRELEINTALSRLYAPLVMPSSTIVEIARAVLDQAKNLTRSRHGYVSEIDPETGDNVGHTLTEMLKGQCRMTGPGQNQGQGIIFHTDKNGRYSGLWGRALNNKKAFFTNDPASQPSSRGIPDGHIPLKNFLSVPVMLGKTLVGQIALANAERDYSDKDVLAVQRLAEFYTLAIQRMRAEQALKASEANFSALAQNANDAILIAMDDRSHEYANRRAETLTGYTVEDLLKTGSLRLVRVEPNKKSEPVRQKRSGREKTIRQYETVLIRKDGSTIPVEVSVSKTVWRGKSADLVFLRDIAERKAMEEQIRQDIQEKEVLLKEIHHRVKNNMQIISSLLNLQSQYIKDEKTLELFRESQNRIRSMALIHERLYQSGNLAQVPFGDYVQTLAFHLFRTFGVAVGKVDLRIDIRNVFLEVGTAIPCGLIINELVSNALKYAFPPGHNRRKANRITISVKPLPPDRTVLRVKDNGIGLPKNLNPDTTRSLGLRIVKALVGQIEGTLEVKRDKGTVFSITFNE